MVLGKLPVLGRPTNFLHQRPIKCSHFKKIVGKINIEYMYPFSLNPFTELQIRGGIEDNSR